MVTPIYIIVTALGLAFLMGFFRNKSLLARFLSLAGIAFMAFVSLQWLFAHLTGPVHGEVVFTAGFMPPFSISLRMGLYEAALVSMINVFGLMGLLFLWDSFSSEGHSKIIVFLLALLGMNVMIMTEDLFNLFVFLEITTIAIAGSILFEKNMDTFAAGFKYLIAGGVISAFMLIGIILIYKFSGSLYINEIAGYTFGGLKASMIAVFLLLMAVLLELKPFPANGWGLDVYESAHPGVSALLSAAFATAMLFVLYKLLPLFPQAWHSIIAVIGILTFVGSNLLGIKQKNARRLLGYSSVGQIGLISAVIGLSSRLGDDFIFIAFTLLITHYFAKSGLFWIAGILKKKEIGLWGILRKEPLFLIMFLLFLLALLGFPPFPSFFGKWELIMTLSQSGSYIWLALILLGSFFEGVYVFRWIGQTLKENNENAGEINFRTLQSLPPVFFAAMLLVAAYFTAMYLQINMLFLFLPLLFVMLMGLLDWLPVWIKNSLSIVAMAFVALRTMPGLYDNDLLRFIFMGIFLLGGILTLIAGYSYKGKRLGFYPSALLMFSGLGGIIMAETLLEFFFAWELMTVGSYFLIIRGKHSLKHAFVYMLFSLGGAYLLLAGFGLANAQTGMWLESLAGIYEYKGIIFTLLAIAFMTKTASLGLHIWLPGAHAEAESDVSPMVSAILLKAGVFGLLIVILAMGAEEAGSNTLLYILGWLGAITALVGNLAASFQEDAKRLLAYSSIGQLGYILFAFAMASHMGWLGGFVYVLNHFAFKAVLFLTIGAIVLRLGTHNMYEMGGLIKRMPLAFIAVLMGIITLSGVPPLSGFAGKWFFYHALILKGWYFQGAVVLFAGIIAFLYCYRLIQTIFLGQLKDNHRQVKEISIWFLIPIYTLLAGIMLFSARPHWVLEPVSEWLMAYFPSTSLEWNAGTATSILGYWNGTWIMYIVGTMFVILLAWLFLLNAKAVKVKQFNIVYSGERPFRPETTHMAHNMYAGYQKALGFIAADGITTFWTHIADFFTDLAGFLRRVYNGNGQTYAWYIVAWVVIIYFMIF